MATFYSMCLYLYWKSIKSFIEKSKLMCSLSEEKSMSKLSFAAKSHPAKGAVIFQGGLSISSWLSRKHTFGTILPLWKTPTCEGKCFENSEHTLCIQLLFQSNFFWLNLALMSTFYWLVMQAWKRPLGDVGLSYVCCEYHWLMNKAPLTYSRAELNKAGIPSR